MKKTTIIASLVLSLFFLTISVFAQDNMLDTSFGNNGILEIDFSASYHYKLFHGAKHFFLDRSYNGKLICLDDDGSYDKSFGENGIVYCDSLVTRPDSVFRFWQNFAQLPSGGIIVGFAEKIKEVTYSVNIIKLTPNGSLDKSFGNNGIARKEVLPFHVKNNSRYFEIGSARFVIGSNNKITTTVMVSQSQDAEKDTIYTQLWRLNEDGTTDLTFGENGFCTIPLFATPSISKLAINSEGNVYIASRHYVSQVTNSGNFETNFGIDGIFDYSLYKSIDTTLQYYDEIFNSIKINSKNKLVLFLNRYDSTLTRTVTDVVSLNQNGSFNTSFGNNGIKTIDFGVSNWTFDFDIDPYNTIVGCGETFDNNGDSEYSAFFKIKQNGDFLNGFGVDGKVKLTVPDNENVNGATKLVINPDDGKITALITRYNPAQGALLRLIPKIPTKVHVSGDVSGTWDADTIYVDGDITVPLNKTLTIAPATTVLFTGVYRLLVNGELVAKGTEKEKIYFTAIDSVWWRGIVVQNTNATGQPASSIKYCNFTKVGGGSWTNIVYGTLRFDNSEANVSDIFIHNNYYTNGLSLKKATGIITNSHSTSALWMDSTTSFAISNTYFDSTGISMYNSSPVVKSCTIENSTGIYAKNSSPLIKNTALQNAGVRFTDSSPVLEFVTIKNHKSGIPYGGGGYFDKSNVILKNVTVSGNTAGQYGGGLLFTATTGSQTYTATLENCLIVKNSVIDKNKPGGGIVFWGHYKGKFTNCTIADNKAKDWAAVQTDRYSKAYLKNCIVWNNGNNLDFQAGGFYNYSIIQGNYYGEDTAKTNFKNVDPLFRDAENGDYHLQSTTCGNSANSPAIDAGDPTINDLLLDCATAGLGTRRSDIGVYGGANVKLVVGIENELDNEVMPSQFKLMQNYPNPFNPSTTIQFSIPKTEMVSLKVYNILGEEVATLVNREMNAGNVTVKFDASHLSSGLYLYRIQASNFVDVKKMMLLK